MSENTNHDLGHKIGETVRSALQSGDLSRLKDIGTAVEESVGSKKNVNAAQDNGKQPQNQPQNQQNESQPLNNPYNKNASMNKNANNGSLRKYEPKKMVRYGPKGSVGVAPMVLGTMGLCGFGLGTLIFGIMAITTSISVIPAQICGFGAALSIALLFKGTGKMGLASRLRKYCALLAEKNVMTFEELSARTGISEKKIRKDIKKGRKKNLLKLVRTDAQETSVICGEDAYKLYIETEDARRQREREEEEKQILLQEPGKAEIVLFKEEGEKILAKIKQANRDIPGEEISEQISRLEITTTKIFNHVEKHPEKLPEIRKFMEYYLPTTVKLIEKYRQYETHEVQVNSIVKARQEIENALETINHAFVNLLDNLYAEETLDISTDISVLQTMLAQEGLTGKNFTLDEDV